MNSKQLYFYLNLEDQCLFDQMLKADEQIIFCRYQAKKMHPIFLESTVIKEVGEEALKIIMVRKTDIENIKYRKVTGRNSYFIDTLRSPVIEYSRCYVTKKLVRRGRLYFLKKYYDDNNTLIEKPRDFVVWANHILGAARKNLAFHSAGELIGSGASIDASLGVELISI